MYNEEIERKRKTEKELPFEFLKSNINDTKKCGQKIYCKKILKTDIQY